MHLDCQVKLLGLHLLEKLNGLPGVKELLCHAWKSGEGNEAIELRRSHY
jgi:hypothetical protein